MNETPGPTDNEPFEKPRISMLVLGIILACGVIGAFLLSGCNNLSTVPSPFATITPTTTFTPTSTATSTPTATPSAMPTVTYTPRPKPTATLDQRVLNPANQHLYLYVKQGNTWHGAKDYCALQGGHLVTIQAPSENKFVYDLATENTQAGTWLGAADEDQEGTWVWVTGEPRSYWNWGEYWNYSGKDGAEDFLAFDGWDKTWYDQPDGDKYFVCEWESASP
jgi:hypothetical protein